MCNRKLLLNIFNLFAGMKSSNQFKINICNCWCTNWAELYIRAPSGNLSWMMRIENEAGLYSMQETQVGGCEGTQCIT